MDFNSHRTIGMVSLVRRLKRSARKLLFMKLDSGPIIVIFSVKPDTFVSRGVVLSISFIAHVLGIGGLAKVWPLIVPRVCVAMVNLLGPFASHVQPCKAMSIKRDFGDANHAVAIWPIKTSQLMDAAFTSFWVFFPIKVARLWVIGHQLTQALLRNSSAFARHWVGRPSIHSGLAIKDPPYGDTFGGFAFYSPLNALKQ